MEALIAFLLGLFVSGTFDNDKIKAYGVGCNMIVQNIKQEQFTEFIYVVVIGFAFCIVTAFAIYLFERIISQASRYYF